MKKIRLFLSISAFAIALGFAFVPQLLAGTQTATLDGWEYVPATQDEEAMCIRHIGVCDDDGTVACTIGAVTLRASNTPFAATPCGVDLKRNP